VPLPGLPNCLPRGVFTIRSIDYENIAILAISSTSCYNLNHENASSGGLSRPLLVLREKRFLVSCSQKKVIVCFRERYPPMKPDKDTMTRRRFLKTSTQVTALAGLSVATQAYGAGSDRIRVGLVGCGGRGTGAAAQALTTGEGVVLTSMGDAFENRLQSSRKNLCVLRGPGRLPESDR